MKNKGCQNVYKGTSLSLTDSKISLATTDAPNGQVFYVCIFCKNKVESKQSEIKLVQEQQYVDGIPTKIFTVINFNFPVKVKNIAALRIASTTQ